MREKEKGNGRRVVRGRRVKEGRQYGRTWKEEGYREKKEERRIPGSERSTIGRKKWKWNGRKEGR